MLLGLHHPDQGELRVLGLDPATAGPEIRARIGYSPEHHTLPGDVRAHDLVRHIAEVHGLPRRDATNRASDALWAVGLGEERFRPIGTMSTGQRQRVKLAQAIAHDPRLVLLDEPTDGLDPVQRDQMLSLIRRCGTEFGIDIVLSSHLLDEVQRVCDAVVIISEGLVVANDTIEVLRGAGGGLALDLDHHDPARVAQALRAHGLEVALDGPQILVTRDDDAVLDIVRDTLVDLGVGIRRLEPRRRSLEDVFLTMDREPAEEATR
jgi:ABC-2 type transport system ATP-binding protein